MKIKTINSITLSPSTPQTELFKSKNGFETPTMYYYRDYTEKKGVEPTTRQIKNFVKRCIRRRSSKRMFHSYLAYRYYAPKEFCEINVRANEEDKKILLAWGLSFRGITDINYFLKDELDNLPDECWESVFCGSLHKIVEKIQNFDGSGSPQ